MLVDLRFFEVPHCRGCKKFKCLPDFVFFSRLNNRSTLRAKLGPNVYEPSSDKKHPAPIHLTPSADSTLEIRYSSSDLEMQTLRGDTLKGSDLMVRIYCSSSVWRISELNVLLPLRRNLFQESNSYDSCNGQLILINFNLFLRTLSD